MPSTTQKPSRMVSSGINGAEPLGALDGYRSETETPCRFASMIKSGGRVKTHGLVIQKARVKLWGAVRLQVSTSRKPDARS